MRIFVVGMVVLFLIQSCEKDEKDDSMSISVREGTWTVSRLMDPAMDLDSAKTLVKNIYLGREGSADSIKVLTGPMLVRLDVDGALHEVLGAGVPAGSYDRIRFEFYQPAADVYYVPDLDFYTGAADSQRFSIIANGWRDRDPFLFRLAGSVIVTAMIDPVLIVTGDGDKANVTLVVNAEAWFSDGLGGYVDPDIVAFHDGIAANIRTSVRAFRDNDRNGLADAD